MKRSKDPLMASTTAILKPAAGAAGFEKLTARMFGRIRHDILQWFNVRVSMYGSREFCLNYSSQPLFIPCAQFAHFRGQHSGNCHRLSGHRVCEGDAAAGPQSIREHYQVHVRWHCCRDRAKTLQAAKSIKGPSQELRRGKPNWLVDRHVRFAYPVALPIPGQFLRRGKQLFLFAKVRGVRRIGDGTTAWKRGTKERAGTVARGRGPHASPCARSQARWGGIRRWSE